MGTGEVRIEDGKYSVWGRITRCGRDISLTVGGGERPHIGAAALAVPRPSLQNPEETSASVSVICVPGHKEDAFARHAAEELASKFDCVAGVCVGIHIEDAGAEELVRLQKNMDALLDEIMAAIN